MTVRPNIPMELNVTGMTLRRASPWSSMTRLSREAHLLTGSRPELVVGSERKDVRECPTFVALLQSVNAGKAQALPMVELGALLSCLGYSGVATLLNSGNAVFRRRERYTREALGGASLAAISDQLNVEVPVIIKSASELAAIVSENPVTAAADEARTAIWLRSSRTKALSGLAAVQARLRFLQTVALWAKIQRTLPVAAGILQSKAGEALLGKVGKSATTRNWQTVIKLQALANASESSPSARRRRSKCTKPIHTRPIWTSSSRHSLLLRSIRV